MTGLRNNILCAIIALTLFSCSSKREMDRESYLDYLNSEQSGLLVTKTLNGITYQLKCLLPEQQCLQFNKSSINSKKDFDQVMSEYKNRLSFVLLIKDESGYGVVRKTIFDKELYGQILGYANSDLQKEVLLQTEKGEMQSAVIHMESANSVQPVLRMAIAFEDVQSGNEFTFVFNDNIFNNGPIKFNYPKKIFEQMPSLNI